MGSQSVKAISTLQERQEVIKHLLNDIKALAQIIAEDGFEKGIQRVGAEQELCIVNDHFRPSFNALNILEKIDDPHFTTELGLFNLEINLDPIPLQGACFSQLETDLNTYLKKAQEAASQIEDNKIILTGILPTLKKKDLVFENMTPFERYKTLNDVLRKKRGSDFTMRIRGIDEIILNHESILFESCNTSFQVHLQIDLKDAIDKYNWSQAIAGPLLAVMCNSPLLMGRELWSETRIALFQQSVDMRASSHLLREQQARVSFGNDWVRHSILELFKDDIARYTPLVTSHYREDSLESLRNGRIPKLEALNLHNGTLYKWNRLCYGVKDNVAHLRIENRYIPSGPSPVDETANALLWVGVMQGMPEHYKNIWQQMSFNEARGNFIKAARTGIDTYFNWFGTGMSASEMIHTVLLPMAKEGLQKSSVAQKDIDYYLGIIEARVASRTTGSKWLIRSKRCLRKELTRDETNIALTQAVFKNQQQNKPCHSWPLERPDHYKLHPSTKDKVYRVMTTALFVVHENDFLTLISNIMEWKNIHHLPVVNDKNKITGIITSTDLTTKDIDQNHPDHLVARDVMSSPIYQGHPDMTIHDAQQLMNKKNISCLPIIENEELVGVLTRTDIKKFSLQEQQLC